MPAASAAATGLPSAADLILEGLDGDSAADRRRLRRSLTVAAVVHVVLLFIVWPNWGDKEILHIGKKGKVFVMKQVRFKKPPARQQQKQQIPKKKARKIPIPDPTPDEPEPIEIDLVEVPELEQEVAEQFFFGIPDGPDTGTQGDNYYEGAMDLGDGVDKPVPLDKPRPLYTEEARQARIQGVVILSGVVDEQGNVRNLKVVKGSALGARREGSRSGGNLEVSARDVRRQAGGGLLPLLHQFLHAVSHWELRSSHGGPSSPVDR